MRASKAGPAAGIPQIVGSAPLLNAPQPGSEPELFTVVAQDIPLRELLFTMARDAGINVDVHPEVQGVITLNAINQTLPQILQRIARQANIRWSFDESGNLVVEGDTPYWRTYTVDYVNVSRTAESQAQISTAIVANLGNLGGGGGGGGGQQGGGAGANNSRASFTQSFANNFWATLTNNLRNLLGETSGEALDFQIRDGNWNDMAAYLESLEFLGVAGPAWTSDEDWIEGVLDFLPNPPDFTLGIAGCTYRFVVPPTSLSTGVMPC